LQLPSLHAAAAVQLMLNTRDAAYAWLAYRLFNLLAQICQLLCVLAQHLQQQTTGAAVTAAAPPAATQFEQQE
jgi:hypothetical protein